MLLHTAISQLLLATKTAKFEIASPFASPKDWSNRLEASFLASLHHNLFICCPTDNLLKHPLQIEFTFRLLIPYIDTPATCSSPWMAHEWSYTSKSRQYQTPTPTIQGIACFKTP